MKYELGGEISRALDIPVSVGREKWGADRILFARVVLDKARASAGGWEAFKVGEAMKALRNPPGRATAFRWLKDLRGADLTLGNQAIIDAARLGPAGAALEAIGPVKADKALAAAKGGQAPRVKAVARDIKAIAEENRAPNIEETAAAMVPLPVMEKIQMCVAAAQEVMNKSRDSSGQVRNAKLMLLASEQLRRSLDTAVKLQEAISDGVQIERFHKAIMDEIARIDPEVARRIIAKLNEVQAAWAGRNEA
jgi:hypothetical protein